MNKANSYLTEMLLARQTKVSYPWSVSLPRAVTLKLLELLDGWDTLYGRAPENSPNAGLMPRDSAARNVPRQIVGASVPAKLADEINAIAEAQAGRTRNFICVWCVESALKTVTPETIFDFFFGTGEEPTLSLTLAFCLESGLANYKKEFCPASKPKAKKNKAATVSA